MEADSPLLVVCLCAEWCGACRDYRDVFTAAEAAFGPAARFVWMDVEDDAALLEGVDVDNFPTLMLARGDAPLFFGAVMPHSATLRRMVDTALAGQMAPLRDAPVSAPDIAALPARLRTL